MCVKMHGGRSVIAFSLIEKVGNVALAPVSTSDNCNTQRDPNTHLGSCIEDGDNLLQHILQGPDDD